MLYRLQKCLFAVFFLAQPFIAFAQGPGSPQDGFSGRFQTGVFYLQTDDPLFADDSNKNIDDLNGPADTNDLLSALASLFLRYQFESGTAVYVGNPLELGEGIVFAAGVSQPMGKSTLDVSANWLPINEVWKNPYETAIDREASDAEVLGLRVKLQNVAGSAWEINYRLARLNIENDEIGALEDDLERESWTHELGMKYAISIQRGMELTPEVGYTYNDTEGAANRYHGFKLGTMLQFAKPPWVFIGLVSGSHNRYQKPHPLFAKTRQDIAFTGFAQVMRLNLFGVNYLFANAGAGYRWSDASIDFFDSHSFIGLASMGVNF